MPATLAPFRRRRLVAVLPLALLAIATGCREDAPQDAILGDEATPALVFLKTEAEETLNRSWGGGNLYKLEPIAPDGTVTPVTAFSGASLSDPCVSWDGERILFSMRAPGESSRNIWEIDADGGKLVLRLTVEADGSVSETQVLDCVLAQVKAWDCGVVPAGRVSFRAPFVFTPGQ